MTEPSPLHSQSGHRDTVEGRTAGSKDLVQETGLDAVVSGSDKLDRIQSDEEVERSERLKECIVRLDCRILRSGSVRAGLSMSSAGGRVVAIDRRASEPSPAYQVLPSNSAAFADGARGSFGTLHAYSTADSSSFSAEDLRFDFSGLILHILLVGLVVVGLGELIVK